MSKGRVDDKLIMRAIVGRECVLTPQEAQAEMDSTTSEDYDSWIKAALRAREESRIQMDIAGDHVEHPTARVLRLGIESIKAGKPSSLFLELLELMAQQAVDHDVLSQGLPTDYFPTLITPKSMKAAENSAWIAKEFRKFIAARMKSGRSLTRLRRDFKMKMDEIADPVSWKTIDRALEQHGLTWPAKPRGERK